MKESFTRKEIGGVIQEIIREYWHDLFKKAVSNQQDTIDQSLIGKPKERDAGRFLLKKKKDKGKLDFAHNIEFWVDTFVDDRGVYTGPDMGDFVNGHTFIRDTNDGYSMDDVHTIQNWNKTLAEHEGYETADAWKANNDIQNNLYALMNRSDAFPT